MRIIIIKQLQFLGEIIMLPSLTLPADQSPRASAASSAGLPARAATGMSIGSSAGGVQSTDILKDQKTVAIHHNGLTYGLQATRMGKLILTK
jgi:hemin uptake protein HemP